MKNWLKNILIKVGYKNEGEIMHKITIIIPVYKVENYLNQCIQSVLQQTYSNLEIILVDDGSPDKCGSICDCYASKDTRIKVIHKENGGLSDARNAGINIATGDYIGFVDSDDFIAPDMYETLLNVILKDNVDIAICKTETFTGKRKEYSEKVDENYRVSIYSPEDALKEMLLEKQYNTSAWDKLYRREIFNNIRYPKGKIYEDLFTTYKLINEANTVGYINKIGYYYRITPNSITNSSFNDNKFDLMEASEEVIKFTEDNYPRLKEIAINRYTRYNISFLKSIITSNYDNELKINRLRYNVRKNLLPYLLSHYKLSSKLFGICIAINYRLIKKVYIMLDKLRKEK